MDNNPFQEVGTFCSALGNNPLPKGFYTVINSLLADSATKVFSVAPNRKVLVSDSTAHIEITDNYVYYHKNVDDIEFGLQHVHFVNDHVYNVFESFTKLAHIDKEETERLYQLLFTPRMILDLLMLAHVKDTLFYVKNPVNKIVPLLDNWSSYRSDEELIQRLHIVVSHNYDAVKFFPALMQSVV